MKNSNIVDLFKSRTAKHITLVLFGNVVAAGIGFLAVLLISRELSVSDFGLFNLSMSIMLIVSRLSSLGMNTPMVKFASSYLEVNKRAAAAQVIRTTFRVRVIASLILAVITFSCAELISTKVFNYPDLTSLIKLVSSGILGVATFSYIRSALHAYQLFKKSIILQLLVDVGKFSTVIILIFFLGNMDTFVAVAVFALMPFLGIIPGLRQLSSKIFSAEKPIQNLFTKFFSYSKWRFISQVCATTLPFLGILMLAKISGSEAAGIYGLAVNLTLILPIINYSLVTVLLPKVSMFREAGQFKDYLERSLMISFYIGISVIPFLFISHKIIPFFFGLRYLDSVPVFNWLMLSAILYSTNSIIHIALYSMNKPHIVAIVDLFMLFVMVAGCYILIPFLDTLAPAILALIVNAVALAFTSWYVFGHIRNGYIELEEELVEPY